MIEVSVPLAREIFYIEFWHFLALIASLTVNVFFFRKAEKGPLLYRYLALQSTVLLWIVSKILKTVSPTEGLRWFFIVTQYLGVSFLGPFFFLFAYRYRFKTAPPKLSAMMLYAFAAVSFLAVATNPLHHGFYATFDFRDDSFGPLFRPFMVATYALVLSASALCFLGIRKWSVSAADILIGSSAALPLAVSFLYAFGYIVPLFDLTPLVLTSSLLFFGLAAFRSHFLGLLPVAREQLVSALRDPLVATDSKGRIKRAFRFPLDASLEDELSVDGTIYRLHRKRRLLFGYFYHYVDVTELVSLRRRIAESNEALAESIARLRQANENTVARIETELLNESRRELHDILGHSLTMAIFLLRKARKGSPSEREKALETVAAVLDGGIADLRRSLEGHVAESEILSISLQAIVEAYGLREANLDFVVGGRERALPPSTVVQLTRCCQEAMTNAVKHGRAANFSLTLLYGRRSLTVVVADNGRGCDDRSGGNGLRLMDERVRSIGGAMRVWSEPGEGFQLTIAVPYPNVIEGA